MRAIPDAQGHAPLCKLIFHTLKCHLFVTYLSKAVFRFQPCVATSFSAKVKMFT
jgi:hypothetical protein